MSRAVMYLSIFVFLSGCQQASSPSNTSTTNTSGTTTNLPTSNNSIDSTILGSWGDARLGLIYFTFNNDNTMVYLTSPAWKYSASGGYGKIWLNGSNSYNYFTYVLVGKQLSVTGYLSSNSLMDQILPDPLAGTWVRYQSSPGGYAATSQTLSLSNGNFAVSFTVFPYSVNFSTGATTYFPTQSVSTGTYVYTSTGVTFTTPSTSTPYFPYAVTNATYTFVGSQLTLTWSTPLVWTKQ